MSIKAAQRSNRGWTLVEMMISVGVFALGMAALMTVFTFCLKGFTAASNYGILDIENRQAMDKLTREIRAAQNVTSLSTNPPTLTLVCEVPGLLELGDDSLHRALGNADPVGEIADARLWVTRDAE